MRKLSILFVIALLALAPLAAQVGGSYQVRDLGVLPGFTVSSAHSSNWIGQVTGSSSTPDARCNAFLWNLLTGMKDLGTIGEMCATSVYVDALGRVGGSLTSPGPPATHRVFFWSALGRMIDIGSLAGRPDDSTVVRAMNRLGEMVGFSQEGQYSLGNPPYERAFYWSRSTGMRDLGSLAGLGVGHSRAEAINDSGRIVGASREYAGGYGGLYAVYWPSRSSPIVNLATTLGISGVSRAYHINNRNQIVGDIVGQPDELLVTRKTGIFIANPATGPVVEIGDLGFIISGTSAMNDAGQVVGTLNLGASSSAPDYRGYRWTPPGSGASLMEQIAPLAGHTETQGYSINSRGQVVGISFLRASNKRSGIFWTPATGTVALPPLVPGGSCSAFHINDFGLVTGACQAADGKSHAVVWSRGLIGLLQFP
ncbi:MAG: hypothetical protein IT159_11545 [Bryobacterales bacterium]|nr:hypothetical protein [Bryobacterales bacterium]